MGKQMTITTPPPPPPPTTAQQARPARHAPRGDWSYELLLALLIAAETCVLYLATEALFSTGRGADGGVAPPILFALLFLGTNIQRAMEAYHLWSPGYEIVAAVALAAIFLAAVRLIAFPHYGLTDPGWLREAARGFILRPTGATRPVWGVTLIVAYAWWRGRTRDEPWIEATYRTLRVGTVACAVFLSLAIVIIPLGGRPLPGALYGATVAFLGCTLAAIALARLRIEQARGTLTLTPRWLTTFFGPIVALLLVGGVLAGAFTRRFLDTVLWLLGPLFAVAQFILLILVYIATGIAWVVFTAATWLASLFPRGAATPTSPPTAALATPSPRALEGARAVETPDSLRYLIVLAILALLGWVLTRYLYRRRRRRALPAGESRESIFSWDLLGEGLAGMLRRAGGRFRRPPDPLAGLRGDPRWRHTLAIRETYRRLLRRGAAAEAPRAPAQTPDEYAPAVSERVAGPGGAPAVGALTARYDDARYSDRPATAEDAAAARAAWEALGKD